MPVLADEALRGLQVNVRILSGLESRRVSGIVDTAFSTTKQRGDAQALLQRVVAAKADAGAPIVYRLGLKSFEMLSDSVSKAITTIATMPTGRCDTLRLKAFNGGEQIPQPSLIFGGASYPPVSGVSVRIHVLLLRLILERHSNSGGHG